VNPVDAGRRRCVLPENLDQGCDLLDCAFGLYIHPGGGIANKAGQAEPIRDSVNKGAETDALYHALHPKKQTAPCSEIRVSSFG
jgi:hypothetical protein